jgi:DNA-binding HxlR family transcriptional regulator
MQGVLEVVGRRWTASILLAGAAGARRFTEYRRMVVGVSDRLLSQCLRDLQGLRLVQRQVIPTTPVQILYQPTSSGLQLVEALQPLIGWARITCPTASDLALSITCRGTPGNHGISIRRTGLGRPQLAH